MATKLYRQVWLQLKKRTLCLYNVCTLYMMECIPMEHLPRNPPNWEMSAINSNWYPLPVFLWLFSQM
jgi:hypothetical protein